MSRLLLVLSLILYSFQSYAGKYDEALSNVKKHLSDRASMYEKEFKNSHERRVSDFYYRRSLSRQVISQELIEQSYLDYLLLTELSGSIDSESSDISELYYLSKNLSEFSAVKVSEIRTALNNLKLVKESLSNECSNENIQIVSDRYDPYTSYVIPKLARDEMGSPVYNYSLKMNFTYAYNDGGGNSSYEVNTPVADGSEVGVAVGFVGAGIACGVSTVIGGGSLCEPTTFSFIAAGITAVFEAFMSFSDSEDFADFQDDLDREYDRINNRYDEIHKSLSLNNSKIVSSICREIEIEEVQSSVDSNINLLEGVLTMVEQAHSTISKKSEDYKTILKMDEQLLQVMLKTKREKFIKQVSTNLSALRERYASVGLELMKFYKIELLPIAKKIKISRGLNKLHLQKKLLETIAKGDMSFGDYKVWNAYKRSLK